ncbi:MAG TPA: glycosyltransferase [Thermoleophilaceae bacterium]|jgi:glycosyltransferase involved in cell wall biosynthesis
MRILAIGSQYPPHHLGGYELVWESGMELLRDAGHEPLVLTTDFAVADPEPRDDPGFPVRRDLRWYWSDHGFPRLGARERLSLERHNRRVLARALEEHRPDAVSWWAMGGMSLSLVEQVRRAGIPSVAALCDDWWSYAPAVDAWTRAFATRPRLGRLAQGLTGIPTRPDPAAAIGTWVYLSEELRTRAAAAGVEPLHSRVATRGPDPIFERPAEDRPWRWQLIYVGRIDERKGVDLAVEAMALLPEEARLEVIGDGDAAELARLRAAAPAGRVRFERVPRGELPDRVAAADALLFPVRWREPWGLVPLEAMAAGTPVIATGRGGSGEYLRHEENCLIFDPDGGPPALAAQIERLASDPGLRARLRAGGAATAAAHDPRGFERAVAEELERAAAKRSP